MNFIDLTKTGGYRFKQFTLRKMQEAYFHILKAFISFCNVPDTGNFIISGCTVSGPNITAGYVYIDGELCRFEQTAGDLTSKIKKNITIENLAFKNGNDEPVFRYTNAIVHLSDGTPLGSFTRVSPVFDANYVHTDNNLTAVLLAKINGIEAGAEVNVQTKWSQTNPLADDYLIDKPEIENILYSGIALLGDFPNDLTETREIIFPTVGTTNYKVRLSFKSNSVEGLRGHDIIAYSTADYKHDRFDLIGREFYGGAQNLELFYDIIAR